MAKFVVRVMEVHAQEVLVDAETREAAIQAVADGDGEYVEGASEYSHSLDPEFWDVAEDKGFSAAAKLSEPYDYRLCENTPIDQSPAKPEGAGEEP